MIATRLAAALAVGTFFATTAGAQAAFLDFETLGAAKGDNYKLTDAAGQLVTLTGYGIRFVGRNGNDLFIEKIGGDNGVRPSSGPIPVDTDPEGFVCDQPACGTVTVGSQTQSPFDKGVSTTSSLGTYFMRGPGLTRPQGSALNPGDDSFILSGPDDAGFVFSVLFDGPRTGDISFEIWDIDGNTSGTERWQIEAYNAIIGGSPVGSPVVSFLGSTNGGNSATSKDAVEEPFTFSDTSIRRLDFYFTGTKDRGIGVVFDNFETGTAPVPIPAALPMLGAAVAGLFGFAGWRSNRRVA